MVAQHSGSGGPGGGRRELHHLYSGLASGRIIVVGGPGAGKSGTAILLLLDALAHRDQLDDAMRARCPVPVLFTAHGWDPVTCSVQDWLAARLVADYPLFGGRGGPVEAATLLAARDKVALILDGLDEMDEALRPAALQALSDAPFRVVVLTRSPELVQAASREWLVGAVVVHLHDVTAPDATDYLQRSRTGPPPSGWPDLLTHLHEHPDGVLARGLSTPLTLTLLRDTYQPGDDVSDLLGPTRYRTTEAVERHLIARVLPAAYTPRAGRPLPRYTEKQARQTLSFIARRMNQDHTHDFVWWHIPSCAPFIPRVLAAILVFCFMSGPIFVLAFGLPLGLPLGLMIGITYGVRVSLGGQTSSILKIGNRLDILSQRIFRRGLVIGLVFGLASGITVGLVNGLVIGLVFGLGGGLLMGVIAVRKIAMSIEGGADETNPLGPRKIWRNEQLLGLTLTIGLGFGIPVGLIFGFAYGLAYGLVIGLVPDCISPQAWPTTLAWLQLQISGHVPAVSLMPFLEDAQDRGVLRTVGAVYQFRHATLQDQLADQASPSSPATSAVPRTS